MKARKQSTSEKPKRATKAVTRSRERDNNQIPGYELIRRIKTRLLELGENSEAKMLDRLRLSRTYWNAFGNGSRPVTGLIHNRERLFWIAEFLGCSAIQVRVMAGDVTPDELVAPNVDALWIEVQKLRNDPRWSVVCPQNEQEWNSLPVNIKVLIVSMLQTITEFELDEAKATARRESKAKKAVVEAL